MDFGPLRTLVTELNFDANGVAATVTFPNELPVESSWIRVGELEESLPSGRDFNRREPRRVMALPLSDFSGEIPRKTQIVGAEAPGGPVRNWQVDGVEGKGSKEVRVIVVPEVS